MRGFQTQTKRKAHATGYAGGGMVRGPGTGISDDVPDQVPEGTYIMPADSTAQLGPDKLASMGALGFKAGGKKATGGKSVPVNLSNGEFKMPPEQVHAVGVQALEQMKNATHTPAAQQAGEPEMFFANGGAVFGSRGLEGLKAMIPQVAAMGFPQQQAAPVAPAAPAQGSRNVADLKAMIPQMEAMGFKQNPQYLADGGPVRRPGMSMDEWAQQQEQQRATATQEQEAMAAASQASAASQIPTGGYPRAPAPTGQADSELTRNVNNALNAMGGIGAVATVPLRAAQGAQVAAQGVARGFPALAGPARAAAAPAADFVAGMGSNATTFANTIPRLGNAPTPVLPAVNAALQHGAQANAMAGAARAASGASAGATGLANAQPADAPAATPAATPAPGQSALYTQDRARWQDNLDELQNPTPYRGQVGNLFLQPSGTAAQVAAIRPGVYRGDAGRGTVNPPAVVPQNTTQPQSATSPASTSLAGAGRGTVNPPMANPSAPAPSNAPAPDSNPTATAPGNVTRVGNTYSGTNVSGDITVNGQAPRGGFMVADGPRGFSPGAPATTTPQGVTAPTVRHSGNDWAARNALRNAEVSASSIMNTRRWGGRGAENNPSALAYQAMLKNDLALQGAQPGVDVAAMRENGANQRTAMQEAGATTRTGMTEQGANSREAGRNTLATEELGLKREAQGFQTRAAGRLEKLYERYDAAKTPEERAAVAQQIRDLSGKQAESPWKLQVTPTTKNADGSTSEGSIIRYNSQTGQVERVDQSAKALPAIKDNPAAIAIVNNTALSLEQRRAELKKLGYN